MHITSRTGSVTPAIQTFTTSSYWLLKNFLVASCYRKMRHILPTRNIHICRNYSRLFFAAFNNLLLSFFLSLSVLFSSRSSLPWWFMSSHTKQLHFVQLGWALPLSGTYPPLKSFSVFTYTLLQFFSFLLNWSLIYTFLLLSLLLYTHPKCKSTSNSE